MSREHPVAWKHVANYQTPVYSSCIATYPWTCCHLCHQQLNCNMVARLRERQLCWQKVNSALLRLFFFSHQHVPTGKHDANPCFLTFSLDLTSFFIPTLMSRRNRESPEEVLVPDQCRWVLAQHGCLLKSIFLTYKCLLLHNQVHKMYILCLIHASKALWRSNSGAFWTFGYKYHSSIMKIGQTWLLKIASVCHEEKKRRRTDPDLYAAKFKHLRDVQSFQHARPNLIRWALLGYASQPSA